MDDERASGRGAPSRTQRIRRPFPSGDTPPGFPDAQKVRAKTPRPGDRLHETVEVYDPAGRRHLGEYDPWDGRQVNPADPTRSVEP
jgi:hypothetical protein